MLKFKQDLSLKVPEYLKELAESGVDISQFETALKVGGDAKESARDQKHMKVVKNTIKRMKLKAQKNEDPDAVEEAKMLAERKE